MKRFQTPTLDAINPRKIVCSTQLSMQYTKHTHKTSHIKLNIFYFWVLPDIVLWTQHFDHIDEIRWGGIRSVNSSI